MHHELCASMDLSGNHVFLQWQNSDLNQGLRKSKLEEAGLISQVS